MCSIDLCAKPLLRWRTITVEDASRRRVSQPNGWIDQDESCQWCDTWVVEVVLEPVGSRVRPEREWAVLDELVDAASSRGSIVLEGLMIPGEYLYVAAWGVGLEVAAP